MTYNFSENILSIHFITLNHDSNVIMSDLIYKLKDINYKIVFNELEDKELDKALNTISKMSIRDYKFVNEDFILHTNLFSKEGHIIINCIKEEISLTSIKKEILKILDIIRDNKDLYSYITKVVCSQIKHKIINRENIYENINITPYSEYYIDDHFIQTSLTTTEKNQIILQEYVSSEDVNNEDIKIIKRIEYILHYDPLLTLENSIDYVNNEINFFENERDLDSSEVRVGSKYTMNSKEKEKWNKERKYY